MSTSTLPVHDRALTAVHLSARRMVRVQRLVYIMALLVGTVLYGVLIGSTADQSLGTTLWRTGMWAVVMAAFGWLLVRGVDRRMRAYQRIEAMSAARVTGVSRRLMSLSVAGAPERTSPVHRSSSALR